ncbi:hypothetical protein [Methylobacterium sp.]|uniref:hypothetical protein n=1 Tax=Methylobacterium sp. TaxID=409 RepID=UPI0025DB27E3|nr:hypothetical protein [Methylobacterium sp.]MBY0257705.1 hypothetical protein [Methylobacterium sp.]
MTVLCAAANYTAADSLAETVRDALKNVRHVKVAQHRVTILQNGEDLGSATEDGKSFQRVTGYRVSVSG